MKEKSFTLVFKKNGVELSIGNIIEFNFEKDRVFIEYVDGKVDGINTYGEEFEIKVMNIK